MPDLHYVFDLRCPRCGTVTHATGTKQNLPPREVCGECLKDIPVEIIRVHIFKGAPPCNS